jgi:Flp pilus assembly protein TadD
MKLRTARFLFATFLLAAMTALPVPAKGAEKEAGPVPAAAATEVGSVPAAPGEGAAAIPAWETLTRQGFRQIEEGDLDGAMASFDEALKQQPKAHAAKTGKGVVLARKGDLKEAERLLREALVLNPDPVRTHYELGRVYQQLGKFEQAVAEFKAGLEKFREGRK